jgi:small neutral amino acid transporter SnatA (MarC family)
VKTHDANRQHSHAFFAVIPFLVPASFSLLRFCVPSRKPACRKNYQPRRDVRRLAFRAFFYSCLTLLFAAVIGERSMRQYYVSVPVLAIAAGIILFLVALKTIMEQFGSSVPSPQPNLEPSLRLAISPLAFPTIVTP